MQSNLRPVSTIRVDGPSWRNNGPSWRVTVDVFAHVWMQALDTLSNFCDNNNIHSAILMKLSFFDKYDTVLILFCNFITKFQLLNSQR